MHKKEQLDLINQAMKKDPDAFSALIKHYSKDMYKVAYAILMNDDDAADAIQNTILKCWEKLDTLQNVRFFKTWLTRILINNCYDILKINNRKNYLEDCAEPYVECEYECEFKELLSFLDEKYRVVLVLYYEEGYKAKEIAKMINLPVSTVQTRLMRGREKVAQYYGY